MSSDKTSTILEIWTDGACKGNPGLGGWGAYLKFGRHTKEICGGALETTNNQMELTAVIEALRILNRPCELIIHTDSAYVKNGMNEWIAGWKRQGWRTASRKPVKNVELWQELDQLSQKHTIHWRWIKGHAGDPGNEKADELANKGCEITLKAQG